jgi:hypothetical protein
VEQPIKRMISGSALPSATDSSLLDPVAALNHRAAGVRDKAELVRGDIARVHGETQALELDALAHERLRDGVDALLTELTEVRGLAWSQVARLVGVSVPAVRKWRLHQTDPTPDNRALLGGLAAFLDLFATRFLIQDPVGWLEAPLTQSNLTGLDVYRTEGGPIGLLELAGQRIDVDQLLDAQAPGWRARGAPDARFRIVRAGDGGRSVVYDPGGGTARLSRSP